jgi:hypothetical protein
LAAIDPPAPDLAARLTAGALAYILFDHRRLPVALQGVIWATAGGVELPETQEAGPEPVRTAPAGPGDPTTAHESHHELCFTVIDGVQVGQRRQFGRIPLAVRVVATSAAGAVETVTSDLSLGGAKLSRRPGLGAGPRWRLEIFPPGRAASLTCEAVLVRATATDVAVRFVDMTDTDRACVAMALTTWARRAVSQPAA